MAPGWELPNATPCARIAPPCPLQAMQCVASGMTASRPYEMGPRQLAHSPYSPLSSRASAATMAARRVCARCRSTLSISSCSEADPALESLLEERRRLGCLLVRERKSHARSRSISDRSSRSWAEVNACVFVTGSSPVWTLSRARLTRALRLSLLRDAECRGPQGPRY